MDEELEKLIEQDQQVRAARNEILEDLRADAALLEKLRSKELTTQELHTLVGKKHRSGNLITAHGDLGESIFQGDVPSTEEYIQYCLDEINRELHSIQNAQDQ